ncbi:hypothetical protein GCM10011313_13550 [Mycetocola zhadangensis]|nr:hypothetical protein GCM10011313_13550 [Mycetocola zhadangensis]
MESYSPAVNYSDTPDKGRGCDGPSVWERDLQRDTAYGRGTQPARLQVKGAPMPSKSPQKNSAKKEPAKSLKEKRADKKAKGEDKARKG